MLCLCKRNKKLSRAILQFFLASCSSLGYAMMYQKMVFMAFILTSLFLATVPSNCHLLPGRELTKKSENQEEYGKRFWRRFYHDTAYKCNTGLKQIKKLIEVSNLSIFGVPNLLQSLTHTQCRRQECTRNTWLVQPPYT